MRRILIVEDDPDILEMLCSWLSDAGYQVASAEDGMEALDRFEDGEYDLVLLDLMLPKIDGFGVCEWIRKRSGVPVMMLTALDSEAEQLRGYELQIDEYVTKPFSMPVLLQKIRAILRRTDSVQEMHVLRYRDLALNLDAYTASRGEDPLDLTAREFECLRELIQNQGRVMTYQMLINRIWNYDYLGDDRVIYSHIFSAASHELKTPITILKGQLSGMLAQVGIYRDREKYLARALEVTGRMEGLVKEILTINRIGSVAFSLMKKPINLSELMGKQLALDAELIEQKGLSLSTRIAPNVVIQGDEALLSKVLDNILINAILYSPSGASINVDVGERALNVENTGVSISEQMLSEIFTPFFRVEQSRNRKSGGSGLGLYLVKSILDLHGVPCRMENTQRGVRFTASFNKRM